MNFANRLLLACAFLCTPALVGLCLAADAPLPAETSFAYAFKHPVAPLPDAVIRRLAEGNDALASEALEDEPATVRVATSPTMSRASVCSAVASVARANDLPVPFFANLIWQESGFRPAVVSPAGAQGIAQFMPETAKEYGLANPFDPIHALHAAGRFLNRLVAKFGNLGLAAAAYNAGPGRVNDFMTKRRKLPDETKNYVVRITGRPAEKWTSRAFVQEPEAKLMPAKAPCVEVAQEVAAQEKAVQSARLAAREAAAAARTALHRIKGRAVARAAKKPVGAPTKLADRIAPHRSADRVSRSVSHKPGKTLVAKIAHKPTLPKRTRVASAR